MVNFSQSSKPHILDNCISVKDASEYRGYRLQYLSRLLRTGKLASLKIGQIWLIEKGDFDAYLEKARKATDQRFGPKN